MYKCFLVNSHLQEQSRNTHSSEQFLKHIKRNPRPSQKCGTSPCDACHSVLVSCFLCRANFTAVISNILSREAQNYDSNKKLHKATAEAPHSRTKVMHNAVYTIEDLQYAQSSFVIGNGACCQWEARREAKEAWGQLAGSHTAELSCK